MVLNVSFILRHSNKLKYVFLNSLVCRRVNTGIPYENIHLNKIYFILKRQVLTNIFYSDVNGSCIQYIYTFI